MITRSSTLRDVCFAVTQALEAQGMIGILTGGSAATIYAPDEVNMEAIEQWTTRESEAFAGKFQEFKRRLELV